MSREINEPVALEAAVRLAVHIEALRAAWPDKAPPGIEPGCWKAMCDDLDAFRAVLHPEEEGE